jgi:glycosyltransferase involved in cell wall biosynthesis
MGADVYDPSRFEHLRWASDRVNARLFDQADAVVAPTEDMVDRVERKHGLTPHRIPYGIRPQRWTWRERSVDTAPTAVTVCRQVDRKRLRRGVHAIDELRHRGWPQARYRLVGTGPQHDELAGIAADCHWIDAPGYVENLQAEFDNADLFLLPSDHEAFGIVLCEALACGLPCVTTKTGGQTDVVSDDVGATTPPDADALADGLAFVLDDYRRFQRATQGYVARYYSATEMAQDYLDLYQQITESREVVV